MQVAAGRLLLARDDRREQGGAGIVGDAKCGNAAILEPDAGLRVAVTGEEMVVQIGTAVDGPRMGQESVDILLCQRPGANAGADSPAAFCAAGRVISTDATAATG